MDIQGRVIEVTKEDSGSELSGDHSSGDTTLNLQDLADFSESGGSVKINGVKYHYLGIGDDTNTLTLSSGLVTDLDSGEQVLLDPYSSEKIALVSQDEDDNTQTVEAVFTHALKLAFATGRREEGQGEWVVMHNLFGHWTIYEVIGVDESFDPILLPSPSGGNKDGGNQDTGFTLPTLAEFVPDGDPDYWVIVDHGKVMTEDQVYDEIANPYFVENFEMVAGTLTITSVFPTGATDDSTWVYPAWKVPLVGQDSKLTIDSATAAGLTPETLDNPWNNGIQASLYFGSMYDQPMNGGHSGYSQEGLSWGADDHFLFNANDFGSGTEYFQRTWASVGGFDEPMPSSSEIETFAQPDKFGLIVAQPIFIVTGPEAVYTTTATFTGVRMEQA